MIYLLYSLAKEGVILQLWPMLGVLCMAFLM